MRNALMITAACGALALAACGGEPAGDGAANAAETPRADESGDVDLSVAAAGIYEPDYKHRHILFNYRHQGLSTSWVRWNTWTGELDWDPENPEASTVSIVIEADSVNSGVDEFNGHLQDERFFETAKYPEITFDSTSVEKTGPATGKITGDLTIKGITKPVTLDVKFNDARHDAQNNVYKLGFSAKASVNRSEFDMDTYVPYIADEVNMVIESEWQMKGGAQ